MAIMKVKIMRRVAGRKYMSPKLKPDPLLAYTTSSVGKYTAAPILLLAELMPSMKVCMVHANMAINPEQCFGPFPAVAIVCGLLEDASAN